MADIVIEDRGDDLYSGGRLRCFRCHALKEHSPANFRFTRHVLKGKQYRYVKRVCRPCEHAARVEYGRKNRERQNAQVKTSRTPASNREYNLRKNYGITLEIYETMLQEQGGVCAICKLGPVEFHKSGRIIPLTVDHDHKTGKVRGLLCGSCNRGIGDFRESSVRLASAIKYLEACGG